MNAPEWVQRMRKHQPVEAAPEPVQPTAPPTHAPSKVLDLSPGPEQPPFNSIPVGRPIYDRGGR